MLSNLSFVPNYRQLKIKCAKMLLSFKDILMRRSIDLAEIENIFVTKRKMLSASSIFSQRWLKNLNTILMKKKNPYLTLKERNNEQIRRGRQTRKQTET